MSSERKRSLNLSERSAFYRPARESPAGSATDRARGDVATGNSEADESVFSLRKRSAPPDAHEFSSTTWLWIIVVPIAVWLIIILLMPSFVISGSEENKLDQNSVILWTLIISIIIWILFFGFSRCKTC